MTDSDYRSVEMRIHRGRITEYGSVLVTVAPPAMWPTQINLPVDLFQMRMIVSRGRFDSRIEVDGQVAYVFTWDETPQWSILEFLFHGVQWRIEYRTRFPEMTSP